jgi:hypothetical protein
MIFTNRLGRKPARIPVGYRSIFHFATLPDAPRTFDPTRGYTDWGMMGNGPDPRLTVHGGKPVGDCAFAGSAHLAMATDIETGEEVTKPSANEVVSTYLAFGHGRDEGAVLTDVLAYWRHVGLPWGDIAGYASVPVHDPDCFWAATYAFGAAYIGVAMTQAMAEATERHEPWDFTGCPEDFDVLGGHCVVVISRTSDGGEVVTWGQRQAFTDAWLRHNVEEAHVVITPAQLQAKGDGYALDLGKLEAALDALA